jgi:hypothetical protein
MGDGGAPPEGHSHFVGLLHREKYVQTIVPDV